MTPVERLFALEQFGIKLGLEAMRAVLTALGDPHTTWPSLHVAGSNGKGSVSAMTEAVLRQAGLSTGRYTSPHLARVEERIALNGQDISADHFADALGRVFAAVDRLVARGTLAATPTFFEVSTAAAFVAFADAQVDVAVVEVGLGGRYDATNVITPLAGAITTIALDHERHLGSTLAAIAAEKAGIAKPGVPLVVGDVPDEAWQVIDRAAREAGSPVTRAADGTAIESTLVDGHVHLSVTTPSTRYGPTRIGLAGVHQADNAVVAIRLVEAYAAASGVAITPDQVERGLAGVHWPARLEWLVHRPSGARVLVDAAHNPAGAQALASYLSMTHAARLTLLTSVMADKDVAGVLGPLMPYVAQVVTTEADTPRAMPAAALADAVIRLAAPGTPVTAAPDRTTALALAADAGAPLLLAGSIYLVGPLRAALVESGFEPA